MVKTLYSDTDKDRRYSEPNYRPLNGYRTPYRRDLDRLIHSTCFRRLQGKTQLYPGLESDFFRNRLTHSLEVAQIAKSIAAKINFENEKVIGKEPICLDIVEFAGLAHDLGHPPFGHQGEEKLNELMWKDGGYEGNAQTLRILRRIEKKGFDDEQPMFVGDEDKRVGINVTARTLASILKYDRVIPPVQTEPSAANHLRAPKGYYSFDADTVAWIKEKCGGHRSGMDFKTVECKIMDLADDIAYSTYDLEDGLKAGFYTLMDVIFCGQALREAIANSVKISYKDTPEYRLSEQQVGQVLQELFKDFSEIGTLTANFDHATLEQQHAFILQYYYRGMRLYTTDGYQRNLLTSSLVNKFIEGIEFEYDVDYPAQSKVYLARETLEKVEVLKKFTFTSQVLSSRLKIAEYRGKDIVEEIFNSLTKEGKYGHELLPDDYRMMYESVTTDSLKRRIICDFVAGMTDRYAIEFYGRLKSENPETIFKPL